MPPPPQAVVFDLGKVLLDFDYRIAVHRLHRRARLAREQFEVLLNQSPLLLEYETGCLSTPEFFERVRGLSGFEGSFEEFRDGFADIFSPIESMVRLHASLRERRVPAFILSNTNEIAIGHIRSRFPFFAGFDGYVLSYEHRAMKPSSRLYEVLEAQSGLDGPDLLYLDDRPENVEAGQRRGWRAILHETPERSWAAVAATGLLGRAGPSAGPDER